MTSNIVIDAGPGSGKTFTLVETFKYILTGTVSGFTPTQEQFDIFVKVRSLVPGIQPHEIVFIAYNTGIKDFLITKLPGKTKVYTFNGLGQSEIIKRWGHQQFDNYRGQKILQKMIKKDFTQLSSEHRKYYLNVLTYIGHLKEELLPITADSMYFIQEKYALETVPDDLELIESLMMEMIQQNGFIEYRDQVWMGLQAIKSHRFKLALVDEAQDLSTLRLEFALKVAENCVFVGDPYQSINAFAGADYDAFEKLRKVSKIELPLKTCFRCPPNRIKKINQIRPARIMAYKTEDGPEERLSLEELPTRILQFAGYHHESEEDRAHYNVPKNLPETAYDLNKYLLIARTNAALVKVGLMLTKHKIPCKVVKRDDDESLEEILIKFMKSLNPVSIMDLKAKLHTQLRIAEAMPERMSIIQEDKARSLLYLAEKCTHINEISKLLKSITGGSKGAVNLSTIHRAKGLEAPFVFILFPPIRHPRAKTPNQIEQEINLEFVAESRSEWYTAYVVN